eukprot:jgi/Undpi1/1676/HiC_scaffold_11.g05066.m1
MVMLHGVAASVTLSTTDAIREEKDESDVIGEDEKKTPSTGGITQTQKKESGERTGTINKEVLEGVAASSTPSTSDEKKKEGGDGVGTDNIEVIEGLAGSSTPSTENVLQEEQDKEREEGVGGGLTEIEEQNKADEGGLGAGNVEILDRVAVTSTPSTIDKMQEKIRREERGETRNIEIQGGVAASSTPSTSDVKETQGKEEELATTDGIDNNVSGEGGQVEAVAEAVLSGEEENARNYLVVDVKRENDESKENGGVALAAAGEAHYEDKTGETEDATGETENVASERETRDEDGTEDTLHENGTEEDHEDGNEETHDVDGTGETNDKDGTGEAHDEDGTEEKEDSTDKGAPLEDGKGEAGKTAGQEDAVGEIRKEPMVKVAAFPNGAVRGSLECASTKAGEGADDIANIATWKDVPGDAAYRGPMFRGLADGNATKYITLEKDLGGFNNIRMSLECAVAIAAATGRTFVIPPPFAIWGMKAGDDKMEVDLRELFSFDKLRESGRVSVITTEEFIEKEALSGNLEVLPSENVKRLDDTAVTEYLEKVATQYPNGLPTFKVDHSAFIMPRRIEERVDLEAPPYQLAKEWLIGRELVEYRDAWQDAKVIHWRSHDARLLAPFYTFVLHTDEVADRYYKRLMRDLVHYPEEVYCKASQVIALLRQEDPSGSFSSFHMRRNDFLSAYKNVVIPPVDIAASSMDHLTPNEVVYIATDEKDLSMFDPFKDRVRVRFLSDYYDRAGVSELNPNLLGMLEQVIASQGRTFTGSWLSTFTAYIYRLRGYLQMPRTSNFSYYPPKRTYHHTYHMPAPPLWATEWPFGWEGIDDSGVPDAMAA